MGAIQNAGLLAQLPDDLMTQVPPRFTSDSGEWVGISGRARTVVYNAEAIISPESQLPADLWGLY